MLHTNDGALSLTSLNHISRVCRSLERSLDFYRNVLGFIQVQRPEAFGFNGAWLFNYGIGIHLLQSEEPEKQPKKNEINPKDNHISFQCRSVVLVKKKLQQMEIDYVYRRIEEVGVDIDQFFLHDPDGFMIQICNCDDLPPIPIKIVEPVSDCKQVS